MRRSFLTQIASVATLSLGAVVASSTAAQAQSRLNFTSSVNLQNAPDNMNNLLLDFLSGPNQDVAGTPTGQVLAVPTINGVFLPSIQPGLQGTITDLTVSPAGVVGTPITPFLTIGGYTFSLTGTQNSPGARTFGPIALNAAGTRGSTATLALNGTVTGPRLQGLQAYNGVFTAQFASLTPDQVFNTINTGGRLSAVSVSAEFNVVPSSTVPEPSTYALLASGIGALGMVARRRRTQA